MAVAFRSAGTWSFTATNVATPTTLTPGAPAGKAVGDLLVLVCESRSITATVATPTGWNLVTGFPKRSATASGGGFYVFTRIADGTATDTPSPVWSSLTTGTSGDASGAGILAYTGGSETLDGTIAVSDLSAQTTTSVIPAFTTGTNGSVVIGMAMKQLESSGQTSTVATFTERADNQTVSGLGHIVEVSDLVVSTAGSSGTATVTWSGTTSARALAVSIGLKPGAVTVTKTQTAVARIQVTSTKTQSAIARVQTSITTTQSATARVQTTPTKTQTATARIAASQTKTQGSVARIQATVTATRAATARIQSTVTATQSATAHIVVPTTAPVVAATANSQTTATHPLAVTLPTGITAGDLLLVAVVLDANDPMTDPTGWTLLDAQRGILNATPTAVGRVSIWYRVADGTEGSTLSVSVGNLNVSAQHWSARITGYAATSFIAFARATNSGGASSSPAPPSLTTLFSDTDTLWFTIALTNSSGGETSYPTNYVDNQFSGHPAGNNAWLSVASRTLTAASETPGAFGYGANTWWQAYTIGIQGAPGAVTGTKTQAATARIQITGTKTQTAVARVQNTITKTQAAVARIQRTGLTTTQGAVARIAKSFTKTQGAVARIAVTGTKTQPAIARIQNAQTKTQSAIARIQKTFSFTQSAVARVAIVGTKTQASIARIAKSLTKTQAATARVQVVGITKTQTSTARVQVTGTKTQSATAHIAAPSAFTKSQSATARIQVTGSKTQTALARIAVVGTKNQTATARIQRTFTKVQSAVARIQKSFSTSTTATSRISKSSTKTQTTTARVQVTGSKTQTATAHIRTLTSVITSEFGVTGTTPSFTVRPTLPSYSGNTETGVSDDPTMAEYDSGGGKLTAQSG